MPRLSIIAALAMTLSPHMVAAQDADVGRAHYHAHCATCHGLEGAGDGPMAGVLLVPPSDLTTLSARHGGAFPTERVVKRIDGREPLISHGSPMPVFGDYFERRFDVPLTLVTGEKLWTSQPVLDLVAYLRELQAP